MDTVNLPLINEARESPAGPALPPFGKSLPRPDFFDLDFRLSPFLVIWETTQACDLACKHCRAEARSWRDARELTTFEAFSLLKDVRKFGRVLFVLTGGDPLYRPDIFGIIRHGAEMGLRMTMTPSGTPLLTKEKVRRMKDEGLSRLAVSLDGDTREFHDGFRGVEGSFQWTMNCIRWARELNLEVQVNTTVTRFNQDRVRDIAEMLAKEDVVLWSVFFLVPVGRGIRHDMVSPQKHEEIFHLLCDLNSEMPFDIKTTAAQHFRRVLMQRAAFERLRTADSPHPSNHPEMTSRGGRQDIGFSDGIGRAAKGVNDGNGFVFISHTGDVMPSGFLPLSGGNVRERSIVEIYREADLFTRIRRIEDYNGKCGYCDYADVCGGSRSRAYAITGNYLASEPYCTYRPRKPGSDRPASNTYKGPWAEAGCLTRSEVAAALDT